jgi:hypothetical protein
MLTQATTDWSTPLWAARSNLTRLRRYLQYSALPLYAALPEQHGRLPVTATP